MGKVKDLSAHTSFEGTWVSQNGPPQQQQQQEQRFPLPDLSA